jgi:hypothetical protein
VTFTIKRRGTPGPIAAEFICPDHGRFEAVVARDENGDPPTAAPCEHVTGMVQHRNASDDTFYPVKCGKPAAFAISAPRVKTLWKPTAVVKGKADERPSPLHMDHSAVADGKMTMGEWREQRANTWRDWRIAEEKKALS